MSNITGAPKNRGAKSDKLVETSDTKATAILLEVAFHDNTSDVKWMEALSWTVSNKVKTLLIIY